MTITEIKESICDNYCKWPLNTETQAELNEHCKECPLNELEPCEDTISQAEAQTALMMSKDVYLYIGHPTIRVSDAVQAIRDLSSVNVQRKSNADEKHVGNTLDMRCDDAVSRQDVLSKKVYTETEEGWSGYTVDADYIEQLPSVTVRQTGEWIPVYQGDEIINYRCSECEFGNTFGKSKYRMNFCPNCGSYNGGDKNGNE